MLKSAFQLLMEVILTSVVTRSITLILTWLSHIPRLSLSHEKSFWFFSYVLVSYAYFSHLFCLTMECSSILPSAPSDNCQKWDSSKLTPGRVNALEFTLKGNPESGGGLPLCCAVSRYFQVSWIMGCCDCTPPPTPLQIPLIAIPHSPLLVMVQGDLQDVLPPITEIL